jgi:hypothetical protein
MPEIKTPTELKKYLNIPFQKEVDKIIKECVSVMENSEGLTKFVVQLKDTPSQAAFTEVTFQFKAKGWAIELDECDPEVHNLHWSPPKIIITPA